MSDIKIQPSATGSGTVTITAPTTNTARVITLPDGTGTLAFTTGDDDKLPLSGGTMTGNLTVGSSSGGTVLRITAANNNYAYLEMGDPDDVDIGRIVYSNINNRMQIYVNTAEKLRIHSSGIASFNDGITLGSGLDAVGANTLDDYEEGNHATAFTAASSGSITVGRNDLHYTKIGNVVHCTGEIQISSVSSPNGGTRMTLPFVIASHTVDRNMNSGCTMNTYNVDYYENNPPVLHFSTGESFVTMLYLRNNNPFYDYNAGAGDTYFMSFTYKTN
tara:strand:- start:59 stop:883 length:825 start_codon:yes stop_codon:yes gene_type:complete